LDDLLFLAPHVKILVNLLEVLKYFGALHMCECDDIISGWLLLVDSGPLHLSELLEHGLQDLVILLVVGGIDGEAVLELRLPLPERYEDLSLEGPHLDELILRQRDE
jgi:hypothetical protein